MPKKRPTTFIGSWFFWFLSKLDRRPPPAAETRYYESFVGIFHPFRPASECDEAEAMAAPTYVRADYKNGQLVCLERFLDGKTFWRYEYSYEGRKAVHARVFVNGQGPREVDL